MVSSVVGGRVFSVVDGRVVGGRVVPPVVGGRVPSVVGGLVGLVPRVGRVLPVVSVVGRVPLEKYFINKTKCNK